MNAVLDVFREARRDNITGESAKAAYYFFLSIFPLILAVFALTGLFGGDAAFSWIMSRLQTAAPGDTADFLRRYVSQITSGGRPGALSIGVLLTIWSGSNVFSALTDGLNRMYDIEETRSWWKKKGIAFLVTIGASLLMVGGAVAIIVGPELARGAGIPVAGEVIRWPLAFALIVAMMWIIYYFLPNREQNEVKAETLAGAAAGTVIWLMVTVLFRLYVTNLGSYDETYGFVGAIIVLMLWMYLTAVAVLFGGEIAAVLEGRRSHGEDRARAERPDDDESKAKGRGEGDAKGRAEADAKGRAEADTKRGAGAEGARPARGRALAHDRRGSPPSYET